MPRVIVFDFGGTLDTHGRHWARVLFERWQEVLEGLSWERFYEAYVAAERAMTTEENWDFRCTLQHKCRLEARFDTKIPDRQWSKLNTLGDVVSAFERRMARP